MKNKFKKYYPYPATPLDKSSPTLDLHNMMDEYSKNIGGSTKKTRNEKVMIKDTKTGKVYGIKTLQGKVTENVELPLISMVIEANELALTIDDLEGTMTELEFNSIKKNIRKGANDLNQNWANALELTHKAYQVSRVRLPTPEHKQAWEQYEDLIAYAVKNLARTRGLVGKWRMSSLGLKER